MRYNAVAEKISDLSEGGEGVVSVVSAERSLAAGKIQAGKILFIALFIIMKKIFSCNNFKKFSFLFEFSPPIL